MKQRHSANGQVGSEKALGNGASIAQEIAVQKEQEVGMSFSAVHPIDTLLVQQLEDILDGERALRARYSSLEPSTNSQEVRMAFSRELSQLKDRADRLYRLVSAMDGYGSYETTYSASFSPAAA
ncbi:MAG: hypothetical protein M3Y72_23450 [Acidobacteriota bacterium]|nr:hypothetical protein [Acidobacteriota bacterium]